MKKHRRRTLALPPDKDKLDLARSRAPTLCIVVLRLSNRPVQPPTTSTQRQQQEVPHALFKQSKRASTAAAQHGVL